MICLRWYGGYAADCECRLPDGNWLPCPDHARRPLPKLTLAQLQECERMATEQASKVVPLKAPAPQSASYSGDMCQTCGSPNMVRTGTCLTCQSCGDTSGGCS